MRRTILTTLTSALALSASLAGAQADQTLTAKFLTMCGKKHTMSHPLNRIVSGARSRMRLPVLRLRSACAPC